MEEDLSQLLKLYFSTKREENQSESHMINRHLYYNNLVKCHCVKSVRIRSYTGPYSVRMRENTDQNKSEYGHFLRSVKTGMLRIM